MLNLQIEIFGLKLNTPSACYSATKLLSISVSCLIFSSLDWLLTSNLLLISHKICTVLEVIFSSVQSLSRVRLFVTPWTAALQASLSITNSWSLPKPISIESVMPSNHLILCRPLLLLPSIFPSIRVFSSESALCIRWPKYWSFSFNIRPSNERPGLISFRMDWLDLLAVQGTLKSLLQHHSSKASIQASTPIGSCRRKSRTRLSDWTELKRTVTVSLIQNFCSSQLSVLAIKLLGEKKDLFHIFKTTLILWIFFLFCSRLSAWTFADFITDRSIHGWSIISGI